MNEVGIFNINYTDKPTNQNIDVVFSPYPNVLKYTYQIYQDEEKIEETIEEKATTIKLTKTGKYQIIILAELNNGKTIELKSGYYVIDKEAPVIKTQTDLLKSDDIKTLKENVKATDNNDGNITYKIKIDNIKPENGNNITQYSVTDEAGNTAVKKIIIKSNNNYNYYFAIQGLFLTALLIAAYIFSKYKNAIKIESRINPYVIDRSNNKNEISEKYIKKYKRILNKIIKYQKKSEFAEKYENKLEKYLPVAGVHETKEEIFAGKIAIGFAFVLIAFTTKIFNYKLLTPAEIIVIFTFGFFVLDILYYIKYKIFRWKLESDFIAAITIMNNAFKSGRSIIQAIDLVSSELGGTVGKEFNRMSLELLYGLEIDVVFERFAKRIQLEEANYLTASLTILNKTGGNIIKVFDIIERNMFDKRKLRLELSSLTSGSKVVVFTLLGMPFLFVIVISAINPEYFVPLLTSPIGIMVLIFMLIYYIIFVVVVRKIMRVVI